MTKILVFLCEVDEEFDLHLVTNEETRPRNNLSGSTLGSHIILENLTICTMRQGFECGLMSLEPS